MNGYRLTPKRGTSLNLGRTTTEKTAETMRRIIWENYRAPGVLTLVNTVRSLQASGFPTKYALAWIAYKNAYYSPDTDTQTIRTPDRVLDDRAANCVDYTVLICCVALHFFNRDQVNFNLVSYDPDGVFRHVYPVVDGEAVDVVPGQNQTGQERYVRGLNKLVNLRSELTTTNEKTVNL